MTISLGKYFLNIILLVLILSGSNGSAEDSFALQQHSDTLSDAENTGKAIARRIEEYRVYLGKVAVNPDRSSNLNPRYPGIVQSVNKQVGDSVLEGQDLARIASNIGVQTFALKANLAGTIIHRKLAVGEFVDQDRLAFSIANLDTMWVDITIRQNDLALLKKGQQVIVLNRNNSQTHSTGKIFYISPTVDQHTMYATATLEISNEQRLWKPGQYVDCYVVFKSPLVDLAIESRAIISSHLKNYVYKADELGAFQKQEVKMGRSDLHFTEILAGLNEGDTVQLNRFEIGTLDLKNAQMSEKHDDQDDQDDH